MLFTISTVRSAINANTTRRSPVLVKMGRFLRKPSRGGSGLSRDILTDAVERCTGQRFESENLALASVIGSQILIPVVTKVARPNNGLIVNIGTVVNPFIVIRVPRRVS